MTKKQMANRHSPKVNARPIRMVFEHQDSYETQVGAIAANGGSLTSLYFMRY
jgi:transposase